MELRGVVAITDAARRRYLLVRWRREREPFTQIAASLDRSRGGLALVKGLVELHGGWVALESEPGAGATFTCHLPERAESAAGHPELEF